MPYNAQSSNGKSEWDNLAVFSEHSLSYGKYSITKSATTSFRSRLVRVYSYSIRGRTCNLATQKFGLGATMRAPLTAQVALSEKVICDDFLPRSACNLIERNGAGTRSGKSAQALSRVSPMGVINHQNSEFILKDGFTQTPYLVNTAS